MSGELPSVGHLVEDQPATEILIRQVGVALPLFNVRLDQVQSLAADRLRAQQLRVVLAEDATAEEGEHVADVPVDAHPADLDDQRVRHAPSLEHGIDDAAKDGEVQVDPTLPIQSLERGHRSTPRQAPDKVQQRPFEFLGVGPVAHCGVGKRAALHGWIVQARSRRAAHLVPVQEQRRAAARTNRLGDGGRRQTEQNAVEGGPAEPPHRPFRLRG